MAKSYNRYKNPKQLDREVANNWRTHYLNYLTALTYQLFEWENLPDSIDPRYLEMSLHQVGYVGFYKDKNMGYIVSKGALSGTMDHYENPSHFHAVAPNYQTTFPIYQYQDIKKDKMGVVIYNNDFRFPTLPSLELFAKDLGELKEVRSVNLNAQKTPVLMTANDRNRYSIMQVYNEYSGNSPVIIGDEMLNTDSIKVMNTEAPYIIDKLNTDRNAVWNEVMTFLGVKNANLEKKERMITDEVQSNNEQISASSNIYLKARLEACDRINQLYGLDLNVKIRDSVIHEIENNVSRETSEVEKQSQLIQ